MASMQIYTFSSDFCPETNIFSCILRISSGDICKIQPPNKLHLWVHSFWPGQNYFNMFIPAAGHGPREASTLGWARGTRGDSEFYLPPFESSMIVSRLQKQGICGERPLSPSIMHRKSQYPLHLKRAPRLLHTVGIRGKFLGKEWLADSQIHIPAPPPPGTSETCERRDIPKGQTSWYQAGGRTEGTLSLEYDCNYDLMCTPRLMIFEALFFP